jgi:hypothetical protein
MERNESKSSIDILPSITPSTSQFLHLISPTTFPDGPIKTFPFVVRFPMSIPSKRMFSFELTFPSIVVPTPI